MPNPKERKREIERLENLEKLTVSEEIDINKLSKIVADLVFQI